MTNLNCYENELIFRVETLARKIASDPGCLSDINSIEDLQAFSRLLLNLDVLCDERAVNIFEQFLAEKSSSYGAFVIFNFICPLVCPGSVIVRQIDEKMVERLKNAIMNQPKEIPMDIRKAFESEMKLIVKRHRSVSRIAGLSKHLQQGMIQKNNFSLSNILVDKNSGSVSA